MVAIISLLQYVVAWEYEKYTWSYVIWKKTSELSE